jgi:deazaflavin-dependent oxidoreductase (nitroreductase family)
MATTPKPAPLPPRWFVRMAWAIHRSIFSMSGGRVGLRRATAEHPGIVRLRTMGRRTGEERSVMLGYIEDGPNLVTVAMNGWADSEPAWWLNLQSHPDATVDVTGGSRAVVARSAHDEERERLWARLSGPTGKLDRYAALRSHETAVVIFEPRS